MVLAVDTDPTQAALERLQALGGIRSRAAGHRERQNLSATVV